MKLGSMTNCIKEENEDISYLLVSFSPCSEHFNMYPVGKEERSLSVSKSALAIEPASKTFVNKSEKRNYFKVSKLTGRGHNSNEQLNIM